MKSRHPDSPSRAAPCARRSPTLDDAPSLLRFNSERTSPAVIVSVGGEIDASNEDRFEHLITRMATTAAAPGPFVIDLRKLDFIGCGAFEILGRQAKRCRRCGIELCLISGQPIVAQIVAISGLRPLLPIQPTVEAALSIAGPRS